MASPAPALKIPLAPTSSPAPPKRLVSQSSKVQTLFDYLPSATEPALIFNPDTLMAISRSGTPHPVFHTLGLKYSSGQILGSNARCINLLKAIIEFILGFNLTDPISFGEALQFNLDFLKTTRPFSVSMENAVEYFKTKCLNPFRESDQGTRTSSESKLKEEWIGLLNEYLEGIYKAKDAIIEKSLDKIKNGDCLMIYGYSEIITSLLQVVVEKGTAKGLSLVIVGDRPLEGERKGKGLQIIQILDKYPQFESVISSITYTSIAGLSNVIGMVSKVFLGAHALLTNGCVLGQVGSAGIALMATAHNIPVLVCCETYKFCDKSPTDSFFTNELGTGFGQVRSLREYKHYHQYGSGLKQEDLDQNQVEINELVKSGWLRTPVLKYDVTPPELVTAVITDVDILPVTSVPVVLRVQETRQHGNIGASGSRGATRD